MDIYFMNNAIDKFLDTYYGTAIGEHYKNWRDNADGNYEEIKEIYNELEENGYV